MYDFKPRQLADFLSYVESTIGAPPDIVACYFFVIDIASTS